MRFSFAASILLASIVPTAPLATQVNGEVAPGERIRVVAPSVIDCRAVARLDDIDADGMMMTLSDGSDMRIPRGAVRSVEVSLGRHSNVGRGAFIGGLSGFGFGAT